MGVAAVATFIHVRLHRRLHRRLDDLEAAVEGLARRAGEVSPEIEEQSANAAED